MLDNRKTRYTRDALRDALLELSPKKNIAQITVSELCRLADLNRGTFYQHYSSPTELLEDVEDEMFDRFVTRLMKSRVKKQNFKNAREEGYEFGLSVLKELYSDKRAAVLVLQPNSNLVEKIFGFEPGRVNNMLEENLSNMAGPDLLYAREYIKQGTIRVVTSWVSRGMKETPVHMAKLLEQLSCHIEAASSTLARN